ncbi:MAG: AEC family transporter [Candidatus Omnitrophica bacterium]|nr:AEC family transporter [Candidatus Omnitrophota bacterium]
MILIRLVLGLGLFISSLIAGWALGRRGILTESRARALLHAVVKYVAPVVLTLSFWRLQIRAPGPWLLPLIGALVSASTLLPAWACTRAAPLTGPQKGSVLTSAFFSNLGFFGAFVAFALRGEEAYGLATLYLVYFSPCFYSLGFALARRFGAGRREVQPPDELRWYPFAGMAIGLALNLLNVPRPAFCEPVNRVLIPLDTILHVAAIGSQLSLRLPRRWLRVSLAMSAIKFWWSPLVGWGLASAFGLEGLPRFIVLLQAAMPVGVSPLMLSILFGLDRRLTNSLFVFTTLLAVPWLLVYLPWIR